MPNSPRMGWPFPNFRSDPWFAVFEAFVQAVDASSFASREDRSIVLMEGGSISWDAGTDTLSWDDELELNSPLTGFRQSLQAASVTLEEGEALYVDYTRNPTVSVTLTPQVASVVPSTDAGLLLALRLGSRIYWRTGAVLNDGDSLPLFTTSTGSASDLASTLAVGNTTGGNSIVVSAGDFLTSPDATALNVKAADGAAGIGGALNLTAGDGGAGSDGGAVALTSGDSSGTSGAVTISSPAADTGGPITIQAGDGTSEGGEVTVQGGDGGGTGNVNLVAGTGALVFTNGTHEFTDELVIREIATPSGTTSRGKVFVANGSGDESNNGLYYVRQDSQTVRLDTPLVQQQLFVDQTQEVAGDEGTAFLAKFAFNPDDWDEWSAAPQHNFYFGGVVGLSDAARTVTLELYNLTDGELVTGTTLTHTGDTTFTKVESAALTIGAAAGNLQDTEKIYEVRLKNDGTLSTEFSFLGSAYMRIERIS